MGTHKTVFITGASRGIGAAIAQSFTQKNWEVIAPGRNELDLSDPAHVTAYLTKNPGLSPDVLVNNAGENKVNLLPNLPLGDWERILQINLTSAFQLIQAFGPKMAEKGWGRIVNMSSCYGVMSRPGRAAYGAAKSGLNSLTRTAALEYGPKNVLVNSVCPGFVETDMTRQNNNPEQIDALCRQTALLRLAQPREIAELVYFLGSESNTYLTGQSLLIDGGFSIQ